MAFHLYQINEVYSNADGTIQYIELIGTSNGQNLLNGHKIRVVQGGTIHEFTFDHNLASSTTLGKTVLLATQGYADLTGVADPDYIIPDNFLFTSGAATIFFPGDGAAVDTLAYSQLPLDGIHARNGSNVIVDNTPRNFAGATGSIAASLIGTAGDDSLDGAGGNDTLDSLAGNDTLTGDGGDDSLIGGDDNDSLIGGAGNDTLDGGAGADTLNGGAGADSIVGGSEDDLVLVGLAVDSTGDTIDGGLGSDTLRTAATLTLTANVTNVERAEAAGTAAINIDASAVTGNGMELVGNAGANRLTGTGQDDTLIGSGGNDTLLGGAGLDSLEGGAGNDSLVGGDSNDKLTGGVGTDRLLGGDGDDTMVAGSITEYTGDAINGGSGFDHLYFNNAVPTTLLLNAAFTQMDQIWIADASGNFEGTTAINVNASLVQNGLSIVGNAGANVIIGTAFDDNLNGYTGNDVFLIAAGSHHGPGELIDGHLGDNVIRFTRTVADTLTLTDSIQNIREVEASDAAGGNLGTAALNIDAGAVLNAIAITGNAGANTLTGTVGNDTLTGNAGNDTLIGGGGEDTVTGGLGNDRIVVSTTLGANTVDVADGGPGIDTLVLTDGEGGSTVVNLMAGAGDQATLIDGATDTLLQNNFEHVDASSLTGPINATGTAGANLLIGSNVNDVLGGDAGNDTLVGGAGSDTLAGGTGNNVFLIGAAGNFGAAESIVGGSGTADVIRFGSTTNGEELVLDADVTQVEQVVMTGTAALEVNAAGVGNKLAITGNAAANEIMGTAFSDTLRGGAGNDTYHEVVPAGFPGADLIVEAAGMGTDTVRTFYTYTLGANLENLVLLEGEGNNGTGNTLGNVLTGNSFLNRLSGLDGNDTLAGGQGQDTLNGGVGNDRLVVSLESLDRADGGALGSDTLALTGSAPGTVVVNLAAGAGDQLTSIAGDPVTNPEALLQNNFEHLDASGITDGLGGQVHVTGSTGANVITGSLKNDTLIGGAGNDTLNGGTGTDSLAGGTGNDTYRMDTNPDQVTEAGGTAGGLDTVIFQNLTNNYSLPVNVENLILETAEGGWTVAGNDSANLIRDNSGSNLFLQGGEGLGADTLIAGAGNDTLEGFNGKDSLVGGTGDDLYRLNVGNGDLGDVIVESPNQGIDSILLNGNSGTANITYVLRANVEDILVLGTAGGIIKVTGNVLNNTLEGASMDGALSFDGGAGDDALISTDDTNDTFIGGVGNDTLSSGAGSDTLIGGAGADSLLGGTGDDILLYATPADFSTGEAVDGGDDFDTLRFTSVTTGQTLVLSGQVSVERVEIANAAGVATGITPLNIDATTVAGTLVIHGNDGANVLTGASLGGDLLFGHRGNDTYRIQTGDTVNENENEGLDTVVQRSMTDHYTLPAHVENLTILAWEGGVASGNERNNVIRDDSGENLELDGFDGNDLLSGGAGSDTLLGGAGSDTLAGGLGDDLYELDINEGLGDRIVEATSQGTDRVNVHGNGAVDVAYSVPVNVEIAVLDNNGTRKGTLIGNAVNNLLVGDGEGGNFVLNGGEGNDTLEAADGADTLLGGLGNDVIRLGIVADFADGERIDGGAGTDALQLLGSGDILDLATIANDRILGIEIVDLTGTGDNVLSVGMQDVLDLSATTNTLRVEGNVGDTVNAADFWVFQGTVASGGNDYDRYASGGATLLMDTDITFVHNLPLGSLNGANGFRVPGPVQYSALGAVASAGDVNGDGFNDVLLGSGGTTTGYVLFGKGTAFPQAVDVSALGAAVGLTLLPDQAYNGARVEGAGDLNGDGFGDFLIGAFAQNVEAGAAYVVFGSASGGEIDLGELNGTNGFRMDGEAAGDRFGYSVSGGDVNGDGFDDLIVGAPKSDPGAVNLAGQGYVVFGRADFSSTAGDFDLASLDGNNGFKVHSTTLNGYAGFSAASSGDFNGDGFDELLIGAIRPGGSPGDSYLVFGRADFTGLLDVNDSLDLSSLDGSAGFRLSAGGAQDWFGYSVASAGDVNGDGLEDMIIGARLASGASYGASYVVFGRADFASLLTSGTLDLSDLDVSVGFMIRGTAAGDFNGTSVSGAGDVNGDGFADLIVGSPGVDVGEGNSVDGAAYVIFGRADFAPLLSGGNLALAGLEGSVGFRLPGASAGDEAGVSVHGAGDVNGDGFADIAIGSRTATPGGLLNAGESYVVFGGDFTNAVTHQGGAGNDALTGTAAAQVFVSGLGNDVLTGGGGADVFHAGAGNDTVVVGPTAFRLIDGGSGADTLRLTGAGVTLDLAALANSMTSGIEIINITGTDNNTLALGLGDLLDLSETTNTLRVDGNAGDVVSSSAQGWVAGAQQVIGLNTYNSYTSGAGTLLIDTDITQTNVT